VDGVTFAQIETAGLEDWLTRLGADSDEFGRRFRSKPATCSD
jgi:hypothetical protein